MKFEKLSENKMKITLSNSDLELKNIDFKSILDNPTESRSLFLDVLNKAEKEVGFITRDHKIKLEALSTNEGDFVLTVTKLSVDLPDTAVKKKVKISRKKVNLDSTCSVYRFNSLDDFIDFCKSIKNSDITDVKYIADSVLLYQDHDQYYLCLDHINLSYIYLPKFYSMITEFGSYMNNLESFVVKLYEYGTLIMKNNAVMICQKYFIK